MDEPTSALDVESEAQVVASLFALMRGRTTLTVAHRLSTIRRVDKILVVDGGRLTEMGAPDDLLAEQGYYARVVGGHSRSEASPHPPLTLSGAALPLLAFPLQHGLFAQPSRGAFSAASIRPAFSGRPDSCTRLAVAFATSIALARLALALSRLFCRVAMDSRSFFRSAPSVPHSPMTMSRYSPCSRYTSINALGSPDAFSAVSARLLALPPPFREALVAEIRSLVILSARFS